MLKNYDNMIYRPGRKMQFQACYVYFKLCFSTVPKLNPPLFSWKILAKFEMGCGTKWAEI